MKKNKALEEFKTGLLLLKVKALNEGWQEEEVTNQFTRVVEGYRKQEGNEWSFKLFLFKCGIFLLITNLAIGAILAHNHKIRKAFSNFMFDQEYMYHQSRFIRKLFLPLHQIFDFSHLHNKECLIENPFVKYNQEFLYCDYCQHIKFVPVLSQEDSETELFIKNGWPFVLVDVLGYSNRVVDYSKLKEMFLGNPEELDDAICQLKLTTKFQKVSEFFKLQEYNVIQNNISIGWRSCNTYGTRFYRRLFPRPSFIAKHFEIYFQKEVYILQKHFELDMPKMPENRLYLYQSCGESVVRFSVNERCFDDCTKQPIEVQLKQGQIAVFPPNKWNIKVKSIFDNISILYLSAFKS